MNTILKTIVALSVIGTSAYAKSLDNPDFLRKLANPANYRVNHSNFESICGTSDLQHVSEYDGSRGQPVEFVATHEQAVGALAYGKPDATSSKYCSGTLISEDLFLTASHCVESTITQEFAVFNYQKQRGTPALAAQEHFKVLEIVEQSLGSLDYAIIRVDGKPGLKYGYTHIRPTQIQNGNVLTIIQHPSGRPKMIDVGHKLGEEQNYMRYGDLDTEPGSSGSGVLDQEGLLVGVHTNGGCTASSGSNAGVLMTEIAKASPVIKKLTQ